MVMSIGGVSARQIGICRILVGCISNLEVILDIPHTCIQIFNLCCLWIRQFIVYCEVIKGYIRFVTYTCDVVVNGIACRTGLCIGCFLNANHQVHRRILRCYRNNLSLLFQCYCNIIRVNTVPIGSFYFFQIVSANFQVIGNSCAVCTCSQSIYFNTVFIKNAVNCACQRRTAVPTSVIVIVCR